MLTWASAVKPVPVTMSGAPPSVGLRAGSTELMATGAT